jgi:hypothetical protein
MRVQRAPLAAEQPQRPPAGMTLVPRAMTAAGISAPVTEPAPAVPEASVPSESPRAAPVPFSAEIDLDLTAARGRFTDEASVTAAIIARLLAACRGEGLFDEGSVLRVMRPTEAGVLGSIIGDALHLSVDGISSRLRNLTRDIPPVTPSTLTVVDLSATRVGVTGDWGYGGRGVVTLGATVPAVVPRRQEPDQGLVIMERAVARLSFTVRDPHAHAHGAVRAMEALARSIGDRDR